MNQNFFIIISITIFSIFLFIYLMNRQQSKIENYQFIKYIRASIWHKQQNLICLPYTQNTNLKEDITNIFLKFIIALSEKNINVIQTSNLVSEELKDKLLTNINQITILPLEKVMSVDILSIVNALDKNNSTMGDKIQVIIKSKLLGSSQVIEDRLEFIKNKENNKLVVSAIFATTYRDNFIPLMDFLPKEHKDDIYNIV